VRMTLLRCLCQGMTHQHQLRKLTMMQEGSQQVKVGAWRLLGTLTPSLLPGQ